MANISSSFRLASPDQDCFKTLAVLPADVSQKQSSRWKFSKKARIVSEKLPTVCEDSEPRVTATAERTPSTIDSCLARSDQEGCTTIVTFVIYNARDTPQPMPPPSRFVKTRKQ